MDRITNNVATPNIILDDAIQWPDNINISEHLTPVNPPAGGYQHLELHDRDQIRQVILNTRRGEEEWLVGDEERLGEVEERLVDEERPVENHIEEERLVEKQVEEESLVEDLHTFLSCH